VSTPEPNRSAHDAAAGTTGARSKAHFSAAARDWDGKPDRAARVARFLEAIREAVPLAKGTRVFEYGAATGALALALAPEVRSVVAADAAAGMIEVLEEKLTGRAAPNVTPLRIDLAEEPAPEVRCDLVLSVMTLHHVPDVPGALRAFRTLLVPGGWLCILDLDAEDGSFHPAHEIVAHHGFDRARLETQVADAGFRDVRHEIVHHIERTVESGETRAFPAFRLTARRP
jgi:SAM-dependent methyltransferase